MKKVKEILAEVKGWGLTAIGSGIAGLLVWMFLGMPLVAGILFGIFGTRNWDIISKVIREKTGVNV